MYKTVTKLLKKLRSTATSADMAINIFEELRREGVGVVHEPLEDGARVLLTLPKREQPRVGHLASECGGIVLEYPSWKVLSLPPPPLKDEYNREEVIAVLDKYNVENAIDGTMVTLYFYGTWRLSSTHGYDVTDMKWMGPQTYMESLAENVNAGFFDALDRNCCYTVIFRTKNFHPLECDPPRAVSISSVNLGRFNSDYTYVTVPNPLPTPSLHVFRDRMSATDRYKALTNINSNALAGTIRYSAVPKYGFILRPKEPGLPVILMRSSLAAFLRATLYNIGDKSTTTEENRLELMILRAWLAYSKRYTLANLMPSRTRESYKKYEALVRKIANYVMFPEENAGPEAEFAAAVGAKMRANGIEVAPLDAGAEALICDYLTDQSFANKYLSML